MNARIRSDAAKNSMASNWNRLVPRSLGSTSTALVLFLFSVAVPANPVTQAIPISQGSDDAEQQGLNYWIYSPDLELVDDYRGQRVGLRFDGASVPNGARVVSAYVQFQVNRPSTGSATILITGEASDDSVTFSNEHDVFSRLDTSAEVLWSPPDWPIAGVAGPDQRTADISSLIQEVVNRPGWKEGNAITLLLNGVGLRAADSFDGNAPGAAVLHLEYLLSDQERPVVYAGPDQQITLPADALLSGSVTDDGLPLVPGYVSSTWHQIAGPGTVSFSDPDSLATTATFSLAGDYQLRLLASDGERFSSDDVLVTVEAAGLPPLITNVSPSAAQVAAVIAISGSRFSDTSSVSFGSIPARFEVVSDSQLITTVPPGALTASITVTNVSGQAVSADEFEILDAPTVLVGAGDIAQCSGNEEATAQLLDNIPGTVFVAGDLAYPSGTAAQLENCYDPSWGRHAWRTRPVPGNHDYETLGAVPYFEYFGPAAGNPSQGYYSYDVGDWHIVALNSECVEIRGCLDGSPQARWLREDLVRHSKLCTLAYLHKPRFSSVRSDRAVSDLWRILQAAGVEVIVAGHEHFYERFSPQDADGNFDPFGIRQFVVGTGGASLTDALSSAPNSEVLNAEAFGLLKLTLNAQSYDWEFVPVSGQAFTDSGSDVCFQVNQTPFTDAGPDRTATWPDPLVVTGRVIDDGFPSPPGTVQISWTQISGPGTVSFGDTTSPETSLSFSKPGQYVLRLSATDGEKTSTDDVKIDALLSGSELRVIDVSISDGHDDAEEATSSGQVSLTSSDLEFAFDAGSSELQLVGLRFNDLQIPFNATVVSSYIQFQVDEPSNDSASLVIRGERNANSGIFLSSEGNISQRNQTIASVSWTPPPWPTVGDSGPDQRTGDLSAIIQEIVSLPGWSNGNSLSFIVSGTGRRVAESFNGYSSAAASLHVEYLETTNQAPVVTIVSPENNLTISVDDSVLISGTAVDDQDGDLSNFLEWNSSVDGYLGTGSSFVAFLSAGTHQISSSVTDSGGRAGIDYAVVEVLPALIDVPNVVGQDQATAESTLLAAGLSLGSVTTTASDTIPAGQVMSQTPTSCIACAIPGSTVALEVSSGPALVDVPNVVGQDQATAESTLLAAGLSLGSVTTTASDTIPAGQVMSQTPTSCTACAIPGSTVALEVSSGPALVDVPNVVGQDQATAESTLLAAGLSLGSVTTTASDTIPAGQVMSQTPTSCTACAIPGSTVDLEVSSGSENTPPVVTILSPPDNSVAAEGVPVEFVGLAQDSEDGDVSASIVWSSNRDGTLGQGATITASLTRGRHLITATYTDLGGLQSSEQVRIRVRKN